MRMIQHSVTGLTALDLWFIDNMTAHHQGAVHMAEDALKKAKHPELKTFARQIIRTEWERA